MAVQTQIQTRRGTAATWTSTNPTLAAGEIGFESDTGKFKIGTGSTAWNSLAYSAGATAVTYLFNATAGQTTFSGADANSLTLAYTVGAEQVYLNGALQVRGSDYTATNGTSIVLTSGALVNDVLNVIAYSALTITDTYTQAQADAKFVQQTTNFFAGKNAIINGGFDIWQRGTSGFGTNQTYNADRWFSSYNTGTVTISQQSTGVPAGSTYCWRSTNGAAASYSSQRQFLESFNANMLKGKTVTFSVKLRRNASMSVAIQVSVYKNATANTAVGGAWSQIGVTTVANASLPTGTTASDWYTASVTVAIPNDGTANGIAVAVEPTATDANGAYWEMAQAQLEIASTASNFQTATGNIQAELAACQRYYLKSYAQATTPGTATNSIGAFAYASVNGTVTDNRANVRFPVNMRTTPTITMYSSNTGTSAKIYNENTTLDLGGAAQFIGETGFHGYASSGVITAAGTVLIFHYVASAEL